MRRKLYIKTFGCQMNEYDSARMVDALTDDGQGLELASTPEEADVYLLNTCSIREKAQEKVFSDLGRLREWKAARPGRVIGVGGCVASQEGAEIRSRAPYVDLVFGPQTLHRLPGMLGEHLRSSAPVIDVSFPEIEKFDALPPPRTEGPCAYVSIMEGCSKYCTFCVVPYTRGDEVSRPFTDVVDEVTYLARRGVREVTLLGQNVNAYRGMTDDGVEADLALLIHYIAAIGGIGRIRFTTSHPVEFTDELIQAYAEVPELADHVHLPVQSGADSILGRMKRGHTALEYRSIIRRLRAARPDISISSDFIVGFPGESDADFEETMALIEDVRFDHSYSFVYSPRPGTPAAAFPDDVSGTLKQQRLQRLQNRIQSFASAYNQEMVGTRQRVLVEGRSRRSAVELTGRTSSNKAVNFHGDPELIGHFVDVLITGTLANSLRGAVTGDATGERVPRFEATCS